MVKTPCPAEQGVLVPKYQIASLIKGSILKATNREAECTVEAAHGGTAAAEEQAPRARTIYGTRPIATAATHTDERAIAAETVAGHRQSKRRVIGTSSIIASPACTLRLPFR